MVGNGLERFKVEPRIVFRSGESGNKRLCGRLACSHRKWGNCRIDYVTACFNGFEKRHRSKTGGVMGMKLNRNGNSRFDLLYEVIRRIRREKTCHILYAD